LQQSNHMFLCVCLFVFILYESSHFCLIIDNLVQLLIAF